LPDAELALVGEALDDAVFAGDDFRNVHADVPRVYAKRRRDAREMRQLRGSQQGLARHAAAQNAQARERSLPIHHRDRLAHAAGGRRGRKACAPSTEHAEIEFLCALHGSSIARGERSRLARRSQQADRRHTL
jgi:hypothetical protein